MGAAAYSDAQAVPAGAIGHETNAQGETPESRSCHSCMTVPHDGAHVPLNMKQVETILCSVPATLT